jgi:large subunit ribosomal protein L7/L12
MAAPASQDHRKSATVEALARTGRKIHAIKLLRRYTGLGLAEAKAAVDEIDRTGHLPPGVAVPAAERRAGAVDAWLAGADAGLVTRVRDLKARDRTIEAIKVVREHTGMGLVDAKEAVERM